MSEPETIEALKVENLWLSRTVKFLSSIILLLLGQQIDVISILHGIVK